MKKLKSMNDIAMALLSDGYHMRSLDFIQENQLNSIKIGKFIERVEKLKNDEEIWKSDMLMKRLLEIKKIDEIRTKSEREYKAVFVE